MKKPIKKLKLTFKELHKFGDELFGYIYMKIFRFQDRGEILIESHSRLPQNVVLKMLQDEMRYKRESQNVVDDDDKILMMMMMTRC